jgi:hypothetical protein
MPAITPRKAAPRLALSGQRCDEQRTKEGLLMSRLQ